MNSKIFEECELYFKEYKDKQNVFIDSLSDENMDIYYMKVIPLSIVPEITDTIIKKFLDIEGLRKELNKDGITKDSEGEDLTEGYNYLCNYSSIEIDNYGLKRGQWFMYFDGEIEVYFKSKIDIETTALNIFTDIILND